jgi:cobalamin biosynthesis Mg chelatase CobN
VLFTEVARVAGTTSQLWADIQRVEQQDGALGTTGSGQVMQDILTVVAHDSYQWDCNGNKLTWAGPAGSSPPPSVPVTAPQTSPATTPGVATPDAASTSTTPPDAGATTNDTSSSAVAVGQTGSANGSSGTKVPMAPLVGLLVLSVALLVFVVYRLMTRD